jgi:hypothetical protein
MAVNLSPVGGVAAQFFDNSGNILTGGKIYSYLAGTTTPAATYTTFSGVTAQSNPIILNAAGRVSDSGEIWLTDAISYKFVIKDQNDVLIATYDNVVGINSNFINFTGKEETKTATQGQTVFTLTTLSYQPGTNNLLVFVNGSKQVITDNYLETSSTVVTFVSGLNVGDVVDFCTATPLNTSIVNANAVAFTGFKDQIGNVQNLADNDGSDWVGFIANSSNAVARSAQDKMRDFVSVLDFGADPTGVTDSTTAFTNALAAAGSVYIPNGTYIISELKLENGNELHGESKLGVILKGKSTTLRIIKTNAPPTDYANLPSYVTDIVLENFSLDMSLMTDSSDRSGIYIAVSYFGIIRNISLVNPGSSFPVNSYTLNIDGFTYNWSFYDCIFPFVRACGRAIIGGVNAFSTTINFYNLNSYGVTMAYINSSNFYSPIFQKEYDKFSFGPLVSNIQIIGGDIEGANQKYYLNGNGNYVSQIVSFGNTFQGMQGGYKDSASTWASCNFSDQNTSYGPRYFSTLTRSGTTATAVTTQNHMLYTGESVEIVGASDANFNGFKTVTVVNATTFTYTVANTGATNGYVSGSYVAPNWISNGAYWWPLGDTVQQYQADNRWRFTNNLQADGVTLLGTSATIGDCRATVYAQGGSKICIETQTPTDIYYPAYFRNAAGTSVGNIYATSTATAYATSSDYRLKNITGLITESGKFIDSLKPYVGTWKADNSKFVGFLAHEVQEVSPTTANGVKDAIDEKGNPIYQSIEYGSAEFIANIVAELQSLRKRLTELEAK